MELTAVLEPGDLSGATLIAGVLEGGELAPGSLPIVGELDSALLEVAGFEAKKGQSITVAHGAAAALLLIGLGDEITFDSVREASGAAVRMVKTPSAVTLLSRVGLEGAARAVAEGTFLGAYRYDVYKTAAEDDGPRCSKVALAGVEEAELTEPRVLAEAAKRARDWVNAPAKDLSPSAYADQIASYAARAGVGVDVWDADRIASEALGGVLGVAAGSDRDPRVVILRHTPERPVAHLALVGKGITFDTGGLSLKTVAFMEEMKDDMAGSAAVVAATVAIANLGLPVEVTCITPLTDNAVGGDATRPGDVLRPVEGPTIEVVNTDAEGRLILADGLGLARRYDPDLIVDVATLTGAARVALGDSVAAVFSSDPDLASRVLRAASRAGEKFWELPLVGDYRKKLDSNVADIKNSPGYRYGSAIAAALFLAEYAGDGPWAHLDIAGPARSRETSGHLVKGGSGFGVATLVELARSLAEDD